MSQNPRAARTYEVKVIGAQHLYFRDAYHAFLRVTWRVALAGIVVFYLGLNALFALAYMLSDGVANAAHGSFLDAYYFSVLMMRTELTKEGTTFYRMYDLTLARERALTLSRSLTVMHPITEQSPLFG